MLTALSIGLKVFWNCKLHNFFKKIPLKKIDDKSARFWCCSLLAANQTMKIDKKSRVFADAWMPTFEQVIG